ERESVYAAVRYAWKLDPRKAAAAEIVLAVRDAEQILRKFRQLAGAVHGIRIHQVWWEHLGISVLARVEVKHEIGERSFEPRAERPIDGKAGSGKLRRPLQVA